jgi:ABC-type transport system involved in multi-copper enzyme maturation permease subunit
MSTTLQKLAGVFGVIFIVVALLGFITPGGMAMAMAPDTGLLLGVFQVNLLHNIVHLLFGAWGLAASRSWSGSKSYFTIAGAIYAVLTVVGFLSPSGFGLVPLGGNDIWLHAVLAIAMLGIGLTAKPAVTTA